TRRVPSLSLPEASGVRRQASTERLEPIAETERLCRADALRLTPDACALMQSEAVQLFRDRATAVRPAFAITERNAGAVAQICARLDGIPLAIELAAARVRMLSVEQIADRMDDFFPLLKGGSRAALPRQQMLRAAMDWSYDLLSEPERALLRRLS